MGLKAGMGRAWLPDSLLALRVISTANNGLPKWGAGIFLLLKERRRQGHARSSSNFPVLVFELGELWLTVGSPVQQLWMNREKAQGAAHCPPYMQLGPTLMSPLPVQALLGSAAEVSCLGGPLQPQGIPCFRAVGWHRPVR